MSAADSSATTARQAASTSASGRPHQDQSTPKRSGSSLMASGTSAMTDSMVARSSVQRASGPMCSTDHQPTDISPSVGTRSHDGLMPKTPHRAAGMRMLPPPSLPTPRGIRPAPTAAPVPLEDPPVKWVGEWGFTGVGWAPLIPVGDRPSSVQWSLPTMMAPASRSRRTSRASTSPWATRSRVPAWLR